jgi:hypothetical protein
MACALNPSIQNHSKDERARRPNPDSAASARPVVDMSSELAWDADTYVAIDRLLFDVDYALRRMMGLSTRPRVPQETIEALTRAWSIGLDMAQILHDEKKRLVRAKVDHDLGQGQSS